MPASDDNAFTERGLGPTELDELEALLLAGRSNPLSEDLVPFSLTAVLQTYLGHNGHHCRAPSLVDNGEIPARPTSRNSGFEYACSNHAGRMDCRTRRRRTTEGGGPPSRPSASDGADGLSPR